MKRIAFALMACFALCSTSCVKDLEFLTLSVECYPSDAGTIVGTGSYLRGTTATLEAIPAEGYVFQGWTEWIDGFSTDYKDNSMMVEMNRSHHFYAHFEEAASTSSLQFGYDRWDTVYVSVGEQDGAVWYSNGFLSMNLFDSKRAYPNVSLSFVMDDTGYCNFIYSGGRGAYRSKNPGTTGWDGVWSFKRCDIQVDEFDLTNHRLSMSANAVMYDAYQYNVEGKDQSECDTKVLKIKLKCPVYYSYSYYE